MKILCYIILITFITTTVSVKLKKRVHNRNPSSRFTTTRKNDESDEHKVKIINVTAKVGETVVLNCAINSSLGAIWTQGKIGNVLTFNTNRITVDSRFDVIQHSAHKDENDVDVANKQQHDVTNYNLQIENVQLYDENEYACQTSITKSNEDEPFIHSLIHLHVTQSPSFVETQTSESNIAGLEKSEVILKCMATGKPMPKIKWYQIDENSGTIKDLDHESTSLTVKNLSKHDNKKYECVASNGILPSVSKKFTLTVYFAPIISTIQPHLNHNSGNAIVLGCVVNSNPDSSISWLKHDNQTKSNLRIEETDLKFNINKIKQLNQTISYLKIKNISEFDLTKYKCEASNLIGKADTVLDLMDFKELLFKSKPTRVSLQKKVEKSSDDESDEYSIKRKGEVRVNTKKYSSAFQNSNEDVSSEKNNVSSNKNSLIYDNNNPENSATRLFNCLYILIFLNIVVTSMSGF